MKKVKSIISTVPPTLPERMVYVYVRKVTKKKKKKEERANQKADNW